MRLRVALSGAWSETESVSCRFSSASASMPGTTPQVESEIWRIPMFSPSGWFTSCRKRSTFTRLSSGSPMPMRTMLEMSFPESSWVKSTWSSISEGVKSLTLPAMVEAQNLQPIRQPTCEEMQTVLPW